MKSNFNFLSARTVPAGSPAIRRTPARIVTANKRSQPSAAAAPQAATAISRKVQK